MCFNCKPKMFLDKAWVNYKPPSSEDPNHLTEQILLKLNDTLMPDEEIWILNALYNSSDINKDITQLNKTKHNNKSVLHWLSRKFGESNSIQRKSVVSTLLGRKPPPWSFNYRKLDSIIYTKKGISLENVTSYILRENTLKITDNSVRNNAAWSFSLYAKRDTTKLNKASNQLFKLIASKTPSVTRGNADNQIFNSFRKVWKRK